MKDLGQEIIMRLVIHEDMSMSEIQGEFPKVSGRTIIRAVNDLVNSGKVEHEKIHGKGKRKRYFLKEENTKKDLTIRAFDEELIKRKIYEPIRAPITQRQLSSLISQNIKHYKDEFIKMKEKPDARFYLYHVSLIGNCLEWNMKLTLAINSGMLGDSSNKLDLARRNKERYEKFLQMLIFNTKRYDQKLGNEILRRIYNRLEDTWLLEKINLD